MEENGNQKCDALETLDRIKNTFNAVAEGYKKADKDRQCAELERDMLRKQNDRLLISLKMCANELCQKCGLYKNDHLGACDNCKWKEVKNWEVD